MKKEKLNILTDFAEGRMTAEEFWDLWKSDETLRELIIHCPNRPDESGIDFDPKTLHTKKLHLQTYRDSSGLYTMVKKYLLRNKIDFKPNNFYNERYTFLLEIQPEWLDLQYNNEQYLINIVTSAPQNLTKTQRLKWCKDRIKEQFRYESKPPRWVQSAEWPIRNGKPLIFKGQSKDREDSERVKYFFYDAETKEEVVVEQYY